MRKSQRILILYGGRSAEHEISVMSARAICKALDTTRYSLVLTGIARSGHWYFNGSDTSVLDQPAVLEHPSCLVHLDTNSGNLVNPDGCAVTHGEFDIVFPILHGPYGEDGTIQGLLELAGVPYIGASVAASAVAMDKELSRLIFSAIDLPQTKYLSIQRSRYREDSSQLINEIESEIGYPAFVKPANLGSSIGISKAHSRIQLIEAIERASQYDTKLLVEATVHHARELECAVLGIGGRVEVSTIGEIEPGSEFYDYKAKYIDNRAELIIPANLSREVIAKAQEFSIRAFSAIGCSGLARVDFLLGGQEGILINEINTMPGFTPISMYPKLWAHSGIAYTELINRLVDLALVCYQEKEDRCMKYSEYG